MLRIQVLLLLLLLLAPNVALGFSPSLSGNFNYEFEPNSNFTIEVINLNSLTSSNNQYVGYQLNLRIGTSSWVQLELGFNGVWDLSTWYFPNYFAPSNWSGFGYDDAKLRANYELGGSSFFISPKLNGSNLEGFNFLFISSKYSTGYFVPLPNNATIPFTNVIGIFNVVGTGNYAFYNATSGAGRITFFNCKELPAFAQTGENSNFGYRLTSPMLPEPISKKLHIASFSESFMVS